MTADAEPAALGTRGTRSGSDRDDLRQILDVVADYVEGFETGNAARLAQAMHPACRLTAAIDGRLVTLSRDDFIAAVCGSGVCEPGAPVLRRREGEGVLLVSIGTASTAFVRVADADAEAAYIDDLQLLRLEDGWTIIAKSWHPEPR
ncbi:nuclear transport factor 2 family protein [Agromyces sp. H66]|uniref:nuclear transport factor 2 family protein n=1 Tax=Agromyces sp. H66 TaxID=2529859 RepID=UPI00145B07C3|nr:nuclear transport factor 2 family protein [Agromyces sp. H66]